MMKNTGLTFFCWILASSLFWPGMGFTQEELTPVEEQLLTEIDSGVVYMNQGEFLKADSRFKELLSKTEIVPADLCFYFGKNSYHLKKYKQSIDWLGKYIELKGPSGQFFDQAVEYLDLAKTDWQASKATKGTTDQTKPSAAKQNQSLDCEKNPYVTCPVCEGSGVLIEQGRLGASIYKTCPYSDQHGRMTCEDYKLYVTGQLTPKP